MACAANVIRKVEELKFRDDRVAYLHMPHVHFLFMSLLRLSCTRPSPSVLLIIMHAHVRVALLQEFGWCHLSAGDLLRAERATGSPDADLINTYIKEGKIVPVEVGTFQKSARQLDFFLVTLRPHLL